ncbi:FAH family protein [Polaromonas sp. P2-4]|nr:FAH family protein [Polaromonas sp. P2-4]
MRLIQFTLPGGERRTGVVDVEGVRVHELTMVHSVHALALQAIAAGRSLAALAEKLMGPQTHDYAALVAEQRLRVPTDHADTARCTVSGTGLTHWGSADARDRMHHAAGDAPDATTMTDSMRMFRWGVEGGKPAAGTPGVQPEWFYKGDGSIVVQPGHAFQRPVFAEDAGEEPEVVGIYLIGPDTRPYRLGFALGNEFSDHVMERHNYLYLAHSKLRCCSFGPELVTGDLPAHLEGSSRIVREGEVLWERPFLSGEGNMSHSIANLEHHHFKYLQFRRPGDLHIHFFGTATLSFADGVRTRAGDRFEISMPHFGQALVNGIELSREDQAMQTVLSL